MGSTRMWTWDQLVDEQQLKTVLRYLEIGKKRSAAPVTAADG